MTNQLAIILGALIIGLSIIGAQFVGRYQVAPGVNAGGGDPFFWRIDQLTGGVKACGFKRSTASQIDPNQAKPPNVFDQFDPYPGEPVVGRVGDGRPLPSAFLCTNGVMP
jgi:hypothetical protein